MSRTEDFAAIMRRAYDHNYRGPGHKWGFRKELNLLRILETEDWDTVLRGERLCQCFWGLPLMAGSWTGSKPPTEFVGVVVTEKMQNVWKRHFAALQRAEDPIAYYVAHGLAPV